MADVPFSDMSFEELVRLEAEHTAMMGSTTGLLASRASQRTKSASPRASAGARGDSTRRQIGSRSRGTARKS